MNIRMTTEEKIRVHFSSLVKALEELRTGSLRCRKDIDQKTFCEIRAIELELDKIGHRLENLQF